jgi:xanthine/uracil permease
VAPGEREAAAARQRGGAVLGPIVLIIGAIGLVTGWLLPFAYTPGSLYERSFGSGGWGIQFWNGYAEVPNTLADQAYFGFAAPAPLLAGLLVMLAIGGFVRANAGLLQRLGLLVALLWGVGLAVLFVVVEIGGNWGGELIAVLRDLSPGGIILFLAALIVLIGTLTRFGRG